MTAQVNLAAAEIDGVGPIAPWLAQVRGLIWPYIAGPNLQTYGCLLSTNTAQPCRGRRAPTIHCTRPAMKQRRQRVRRRLARSAFDSFEFT